MSERTSPGRDRVYAVVVAMLKRGQWPTVRSIMRESRHASTSTVQHHLDMLVRDGRILRETDHPYRISLPEAPDASA